MASTPERVRIHYHRPPDRTDVYEQDLLERSDACTVTFLLSTPLRAPLLVGGRSVLEDGAPVVWFTFPGVWHDIGRFHDARANFTGLYANILTPVAFEGPLSWKTTDLFLDVWVDAQGKLAVLDEEELDRALERGWVDAAAASRAREEVAGIRAAWAAGTWPPAIVHEWTLERALRTLRGR